MGSLLEGGKSRVYEKMLQMQNDERVRIRLITTELARKVFLHSAKDRANRFVEVLCTSLRGGCSFCQVNAAFTNKEIKKRELEGKTGDALKIDNQLKPYPGRLRFVNPVWAYERNAALLLGGKEVWEQIDGIHTTFGSAMDRDIVITRKKLTRVTYQAMSDAPTPFTVQIDPMLLPTADDYIQWLRDNIADAVMVDEDGRPIGVPASAPAAVVTAPTVVPPAAPGTIVLPRPAPVPVKKDEEVWIDLITDEFVKCMDRGEIDRLQKECAGGKVKFNEYTVQELQAFHKAYREVVKKAGK